MNVDGGGFRQHDDGELMARAAEGDTDAFAELYRRHADAAWRAARALLANTDDAADAVADVFTRVLRAVREGRGGHIAHFRAYLLTATRHAALDRRRGREIAVDLTLERNGDDDMDTSPTPSELVVDLTDESFVMRALADLPERWRRVLWLTEVEGLRPVDAAEQLGMNANSVAQLAYRARSALRERYVQAHVRESDDDACATTVEHLGAYAVGKLAERERRAVEEHLAECEDCRQRCLDLDDVRPGPRHLRALAPIGLVGGATKKALDSGTSGMFSGAPAGILGKAAMIVAGVAISGSTLLDVGDAPPAAPIGDVPRLEEEEPLTHLVADPVSVVEQHPSTTSTTVEPSGGADSASTTSSHSADDASNESATTTTTTTTTIPRAANHLEAMSSEGEDDTATAGDPCKSDGPGRSGSAPGRTGDESGRNQSSDEPGQSGEHDCAPGQRADGPDTRGEEGDSDRAPDRSDENRYGNANANGNGNGNGSDRDGNRGGGEPTGPGPQGDDHSDPPSGSSGSANADSGRADGESNASGNGNGGNPNGNEGNPKGNGRNPKKS